MVPFKNLPGDECFNCLFVRVCVCERDREKERERKRDTRDILDLSVRLNVADRNCLICD